MFALVFWDLKMLKNRLPASNLLKLRVSLLLQPTAHCLNMWRSPQLDRPAVPSYICWGYDGIMAVQRRALVIGQLLLEITYSSYFKGHFSSPPFFNLTHFAVYLYKMSSCPSPLSPLTSLSSPRISLEKRLHSSSMSSTLISRQGVVLHAAMLDSTMVIMSHSSFSRPTSRLRGYRRVDTVNETSVKSETLQILTVNVKECPCYNGSLVLNLAQDRQCFFSFQLWALPALSELFVLGDGDLEQAGRLHQGGHHCLPLPDLPVERIQHLVGALAVKPGRLHEPTQAPIKTHTHTHTHLHKPSINQAVFR